MFETLMYLVLELLAVDGGPSTPGACRVSALYHEVRDDAVEDGVGEIVARAKLGKVGAGFWGVGVVKFDCDGSLDGVSGLDEQYVDEKQTIEVSIAMSVAILLERRPDSLDLYLPVLEP